MYKIKEELKEELKAIKDAGLYKLEGVLNSAQGAWIELEGGKKVLNICANNYLGLSNDEEVVKAVEEGLKSRGYGLSSVRFICGTQDIHKELEAKVSSFLGMEDTILYASCFDANGGVFEPLLSDLDGVISDELNHASIIDGIRLCKAKRFRYKNRDLADLERCLKEAQGLRRRLIVTDGVFSMDGHIAPLDEISALADKYGALLMIDESHSSGFMGKNGRGVHELKDCIDKIDIISGTFGKALGGANGGFISAKKEIVEILRQNSRPYLFSNTLAPYICLATIKVFDILSSSTKYRDKLEENTLYYREALTKEGFDIIQGTHPIVPIMLYDAKLAQDFSKRLLEKGVYAVGFFYPVVPKGKARIRTQVSAAHSKEDLDFAIKTFCEVREELKV